MYLLLGSPDRRHLLGLFEGDAFVSSDAWTVPEGEQTDLAERADAMLRANDVAWADLEGIVVVTGPGSFSFSRTGVTIANAFRFANDLPLLGVSVLQLGALAVRAKGEPADTTALSVMPTMHGSWFAGEGQAGESGLPELRCERLSEKELIERAGGFTSVGEGISSFVSGATDFDWHDSKQLEPLLVPLSSCSFEKDEVEPEYILSPSIGQKN